MPDPLTTQSASGTLWAAIDQTPRAHRNARPIATTSIEAHEASDRDNLRMAVLRWMRDRGGEGSFDQFCREVGAKSSQSGRFTELRDLGLIERTNAKTTTESGGHSWVHRLTDAGRGML